MNNIFRIIPALLFTTVLNSFLSCSKIIDVGPPIDQLTPEKVFVNDASAVSVVSSIYIQLSVFTALESWLTNNMGMYSDELMAPNNSSYTPFLTNTILPDNTRIQALWTGLYKAVYNANDLLEKINQSENISDATKKQVSGEAMFLRAFCYFYLTHLWGDLPLVTTTDVTKTAYLPRTSKDSVMAHIIADLKGAENLLSESYPGSERVRVNKWAATAMLARAYLYAKDWPNAETKSNEVIQSGRYNPIEQLGGVFLKKSKEAILQWWKDAGYTGSSFVPTSGAPPYWLYNNFPNSFETGDERRNIYIQSKTISGTTYYYPFKYRRTTNTTGDSAEYSLVLRLTEQYLIRAEARAYQDKIIPASADINVVRHRANLPEIPASLSKEVLLEYLFEERKREMFAEWGHRWFDLKRTGKLDQVLGSLKPAWKSSAELFPIPIQEINKNPSLTQNKGY